jgi:hypothetical protein
MPFIAPILAYINTAKRRIKMKNNPVKYIWAIFISGMLASSSVWAASGSCTYLASGAGGTGTSGTGMGGTGMLAKGTGMGGTGMKPGIEIAELKVAGNVIASSGPVEAQSNGRTRLLAKGDSVCVGETIVTQQTGKVQIRMIDDGLIAIRPQSQLKIEKFAFNGTDQDSSLISLFKGASRFVTGRLGKLHPQNDLIHTPYATIGVRGTDHVATVVLPGNSAGYIAGTYDKVNQGITFIRTDKGEIDILPSQVGMAANMADAPALLNSIPEFYREGGAAKEKGEVSEQGKAGESASDRKVNESVREHAGNGTEVSHSSSESGSTPGEIHGNMPEKVNPEFPTAPASHEMTAPELPESPNMPQLPEIPEAPKMPES